MAKMFGGAKVPAPTVVNTPEPTVMPVVDETLVNKNKKKQLVASANRSGRVSTILSDNNSSNVLGG